MDVEQPLPNDFDPERPYVDGPDWGINRAAHDAAMAGAYYRTLLGLGVPPKRAERMTALWMELRTGE